jgi:formylglycine-generating enzyme required for sulfatase activity
MRGKAFTRALARSLPSNVPQNPKGPVKVPSTGAGATQLKTLTNAIGMKLTLIPAGMFRTTGNLPQLVRITRPFYLGVHEVTQVQYEALMGNNPSSFSSKGDGRNRVVGQSTDQHPVENVSWLDAVAFATN